MTAADFSLLVNSTSSIHNTGLKNPVYGERLQALVAARPNVKRVIDNIRA